MGTSVSPCQLVSPVHRKNCEPLVPGPALAMDRIPAPVCFSTKFSSSNQGPTEKQPASNALVKIGLHPPPRVRTGPTRVQHGSNTGPTRFCRVLTLQSNTRPTRVANTLRRPWSVTPPFAAKTNTREPNLTPQLLDCYPSRREPRRERRRRRPSAFSVDCSLTRK